MKRETKKKKTTPQTELECGALDLKMIILKKR